MSEARVEPPALVWWRAQLRRKHEAMQRVERPMRAQMLVVLAVVCVGLGLAFRLSGGATAWRAWMSAGAEAVVRSGVGEPWGGAGGCERGGAGDDGWAGGLSDGRAEVIAEYVVGLDRGPVAA